MFKLIIFNLFCLSFINYCCYAISQPDQFKLIANHNPHLAFHQPNLAIQAHPHQFKPNHFATQLHSRPNQQDILRGNRLIPAASSSNSAIIHTRAPQESINKLQSPQFNHNNFKPINRPQFRSNNNNNNQKRFKKPQQPQRQQRNHGNHHHLQSKINWGRCPMLQPSIEEKIKKASVITKCLEMTPVPENITRETIELHRELVAACCLKKENWFTSALSSDENLTKINVNNSKIVLNTTLTTSSVDENRSSKNSSVDLIRTNNTIKETNLKLNSKNESLSKDDLKDVFKDSESQIKSVYSNNTKIDQNNEKVTNSTSSSFKINESIDNQQTNNENKHSALQSDDYGEEDMASYSEIFTGQLIYNYNKAKNEIKFKKFDPDIEEKVLTFHENCKDEAQEKFNNPIQIIGQIQLYQSCMDWHISSVCGIEVTY